MDGAPIPVSLTRSEAIVFIEFLMRFRDKDLLAVEHEAEQQLLYDLCCVVEQELPELFDPGWKSIVEQARETLLTNSDNS